MKRLLVILILLASHLTFNVSAQSNQAITLEEAVRSGLENHPSLKQAALQIEQRQQLKAAAWELPKTDVSLMRGQYNSYNKNDNNLTLTQSLPFPTVFKHKTALAHAGIREAEIREVISQQDLKFQICNTFNELLLLKELRGLYEKQDSLLSDLLHTATLQRQLGEGTWLGQTMAETNLREHQLMLMRLQADWRTQLDLLKTQSGLAEISEISGSLQDLPLVPISDSSDVVLTSPHIALWQQQHTLTLHEFRVARALAMPDLRLGYFNQTLIGYQTVNNQEQYFSSSDRFQGIIVGIAIPVFARPYHAQVKAASLQVKIAAEQERAATLALSQEYRAAMEAYHQSKSSLAYYVEQGLPAADLMTEQSRVAFRAGEIPYATMLLTWKQSLAIREGYLHALKQYNQSIITLHYLSGTL